MVRDGLGQMSAEIRRDVVDAGITFSVRVPDEWLEYPSEQALLTLSGDLGQPEGTLRPTVLLDVIAADGGAESAFAAIKQELLSLPEASVVAESAGQEAFPQYSVLVGFRNGETGGVQLTMIYAQYVASATVPVVVYAQGNCGGAADAEVVQALSEVVRSTAVTLVTAAQ
jgi:hypothetical protein